MYVSLLFPKMYFKNWQRIKRIACRKFVISFKFFKEISIVSVANLTLFLIFLETNAVVFIF